jgi:hypothetical protein
MPERAAGNSPPRAIELECEEFTAHDSLTDTRLLRSTFAEVGEWIYSRYRDRIVKKMGFSPATNLDLVQSKIEIRFRLSNGNPISHDRRVSTTSRLKLPITWRPALRDSPPDRPRRSLPPPGGVAAATASEVLEYVFDVGGYLAAAGIGGIIGNRADALLVSMIKSLYDRGRRFWPSQDLMPLESAVPLARTAILATFPGRYGPVEVAVDSVQADEDGNWHIRIVRFEAAVQSTAFYWVKVPPSRDPARARLSIRAENRRGRYR